MIDLAYIIPALNASQTIAHTLDGVLRQAGPRIHAIVVDDGSSDQTADIARSTRDWRVEVVRQANLGLAGARNTGFEALGDRAEFVCFLDADDTIEPSHAATLVEALRAARERDGTEVVGVGAAFRMVGPDLEDLAWNVSIAPDAASIGRLLDCNPFAVGAVALHAESLRERAGARPFDRSLRQVEDWDLWLRLTLDGAAWAPPVNDPLFNYRLRPGALSRAIDAMWQTGRRVLHRAGRLPEADPILVERALRHWTIRHLARAAAAPPDTARPLIPSLLSDLDDRGGRAISAGETHTLHGALRHALMFEHAVGPDEASARAAIWREEIRRSLAAWPESAGAIDSLSLTSPATLARALGELLGERTRRDNAPEGERKRPGRLSHLRLVLAGMGQNGRDLADALRARRVAFDWFDDHPSATCPVPGARRLRLDQIGAMHLVVPTPTSAAAIGARLRRTPALVMLPDEALNAAAPRASAIIEAARPESAPRRRVA
ncbi:MAG: glycosyltransferase [Phycisphaeraceae bacterium]|nr:glycosyltransferase [Phycisphaeraceae bacterium]